MYTLQSLLEKDVDFTYIMPRTGLDEWFISEFSFPTQRYSTKSIIPRLRISFMEFFLTSWRSLADSLRLVATEPWRILWADELCYVPHSTFKTKSSLFLFAFSTSSS